MKRDLKTLTTSLLFWGLGESLFLFFQPIYLQQLGADALEIGTILAIMGFTMGFAPITTGYLSDRIGVKLILRIAWIMGTVATAMMAFAPNLSLYIFGMLIYTITGAVSAPMNSYIASIKGNLTIGQAISIPVSGFNLGAIFGPVLGGFISQLIGLRAIYWLAFGFFVISSILAFYLKEKEVFPHDEKEATQKPWQNKSFNIFLGLIFLLIFSSYLPIPLTSNFLFNIHNIPLSTLGIMGALSSSGYILLAFFAAKAKPENNLIFSILLMLIFCGLIFFGKSTLVFSIAYLFASGYRFLRSMVMAYTHQLVHRNHLGIAYGLIESVAGIAITLAPLLAGFIYSKDVRFLYITGLFCLIISLISAIYFKKRVGVKKLGNQSLQVQKFILGPFQNNSYLVSAMGARECVIIDPAIGSRVILDEIKNQRYELTQVWITHAHFDHIGGVQEITLRHSVEIPVYIHPLDIQLWQDGGGTKEFGFEVDLNPLPSRIINDAHEVKIGKSRFQILHTPGHTQGHVTFYNVEHSIAFCGDLIFQNSIGRTDLQGGDTAQIINSIRNKILTLPDDTRLLCGHGPETTVGRERVNNPFLN